MSEAKRDPRDHKESGVPRMLLCVTSVPAPLSSSSSTSLGSPSPAALARGVELTPSLQMAVVLTCDSLSDGDGDDAG